LSTSCRSDYRFYFHPAFFVGPLPGYLGVFIDSDLSMETHVNRTVSRCFSTLRPIRSIRRQEPTAVFQSLIVALVLSRLDYCNRVLVGLPDNLIRRLQSVQNAASTADLWNPLLETRACERSVSGRFSAHRSSLYFCDTRSPLRSRSPDFPPAPLTLRSNHML